MATAVTSVRAVTRWMRCSRAICKTAFGLALAMAMAMAGCRPASTHGGEADLRASNQPKASAEQEGPAAVPDPVEMPGMPSAGSVADTTLPIAEAPGDIVDESTTPACVSPSLVGLTHSPGGDALPNPCEPYHPRTNNPYAIRCIDADPSFASGFPGDDLCILPPPPDLGLQIGVHPQSYEPADTAAFELQPGEETNQNFFAKTDNAQERYFFRSNVRMRTGSHHLITTGGSTPVTDGWEGDRTSAGIGILAPGFETTLPSAQRADQDTPNGLELPPENVGLAFHLSPHQQIQFNLHHFNQTDEPILREAWINLWFLSDSEVEEIIQPLALIGNPADLAIAPGESRDLVYGCNFTDTRIVALTGHRHAWTKRFGIWLEQDGQSTPLYESFDYNDMPTYNYDSATDNPPMNLEAAVDGAYSGPVHVENGTLRWTCEIDNGSDRTLSFANELFTGEMCIVFGGYTGSTPDCDFGVLHYELLPLLGPFTDLIL